jgi:four helix bundle protein
MASYKRFEELEIWQRARLFAQRIFKITQREPFCKDYKLKDQISICRFDNG